MIDFDPEATPECDLLIKNIPMELERVKLEGKDQTIKFLADHLKNSILLVVKLEREKRFAEHRIKLVTEQLNSYRKICITGKREGSAELIEMILKLMEDVEK